MWRQAKHVEARKCQNIAADYIFVSFLSSLLNCLCVAFVSFAFIGAVFDLCLFYIFQAISMNIPCFLLNVLNNSGAVAECVSRMIRGYNVHIKMLTHTVWNLSL